MEPSITFYQEEREITTDFTTTELGSHLDIKVVCVAPIVLGHVDYSLITPNGVITLGNNAEMFHVYHQVQSDNLQGHNAGEEQDALIKLKFKEPEYQIGDTCILKISIPDLEKSLRIIVQ